MGDRRFVGHYGAALNASAGPNAMKELPDDIIIGALAEASRNDDDFLANVLATEATNRLRRNSAIVHASGEALIHVDERGRMRYANPAALRLLGGDAPAAGASVHGLLCCDGAGGDGCFVEAAMARATPVRGIELDLADPSGGQFKGLASCVPVVREGLVEGAVVSVTDVTPLRDARDALDRTRLALEAVLEAAGGMIVLVGPDGRIRMFNAACERATGYVRDEVLGKDLLTTLVPKEWRDVVAARFADPTSDEVRAPHRNPWSTKEGETTLIEWRCTPLRLPGEEGTAIMGVGIEVPGT